MNKYSVREFLHFYDFNSKKFAFSSDNQTQKYFAAFTFYFTNLKATTDNRTLLFNNNIDNSFLQIDNVKYISFKRDIFDIIRISCDDDKEFTFICIG